MIHHESMLMHAGLSREQALVYETLVESNYLEAGKISLKIGLDRTFVYKILGQLTALGLVEKNEQLGKVAKFVALHPSRIKKILDTRLENLSESKRIFETSIGNLISTYNLNGGKPNVSFYEGISGVDEIYRDIVLEAKEIYAIKSIHDTDNLSAVKLKEENYTVRVSRSIQTTILAPAGHSSLEYISKNKNKILKGYSLSREKLSIPAEILIYGEKVAIIDFKDEIITTLIENPDVASTFKALFSILIDRANPVV